MTSSVLSGAQLRQGFEASIENATRLAGAAAVLLEEFPDKALALAQLAQEELGKSLSLLAAAALPDSPDAWTWLWAGWRDHQLKAHRAFLYEIIHPQRIELRHPVTGDRYAGEPLFDRMSTEKEVGFYVDFDAHLGSFVSPKALVETFDAAARISTVTYLATTADAVRRALMHDDMLFRFEAFGELAFEICSQERYQQDWPGMRAAFRARSPRHRALIDDLDAALEGKAEVLRELGRSPASDAALRSRQGSSDT